MTNNRDQNEAKQKQTNNAHAEKTKATTITIAGCRE
jgi:hypothetical protein